MIEGCPASFKEGTHIVRQPQRGKDRAHGSGESGGKMILRNHQRDILRHAVISPHLQNVLHQRWFRVQRLPRDVAGFEGIVLEGNKG